MKMTFIPLQNANPRLLDRLNAACSVVLGIGALLMVAHVMRPSLNPALGSDGAIRIELRGLQGAAPEVTGSPTEQASAGERSATGRS